MLSGDWASRQEALADPDLWAKYGADAALYASVVQQLTDAGLTVIQNNAGGNDGFYTSTVENRTIWVQLNSAAEFNTLFGTGPTDPVLQHSHSANLHYWNGDLSLPAEWGVKGLWFDDRHLANVEKIGTDPAAQLTTGPQSPGNDGRTAILAPQDIADLYNFPLDGKNVQTGTIGLIEPGIGSALPGDQQGTQFQSLLDAYLESLGRSGTGQVTVQGINGQAASSSPERSADVGIVAAINPNSDIQLFNGSGTTFTNAAATVFTAIQAAVWNPAGVLPEVTSTSWKDLVALKPNSPYYNAYYQLFIDAALNNQTSVLAAGDGGSGDSTANNLTNVDTTQSQPYNILVGGTSLSSQAVAAMDQSLAGYYDPALQDNLALLAQLVSGGLKTLPSSTSDIDRFIETVWNQYKVEGGTVTGYTVDNAGSGGVDATQFAPPWYQAQYGLTPVTSDSLAEPGRGVPDVAANAGGNLGYSVPGADMALPPPHEYFYGTSAAAPLWASLIVQFNYIFRDQGLHNLGFMNDLLYIASAIAPGSFNDITIGRNNSTWYYDQNGAYSIDGTQGSPTNIGYSAGIDYDYASGLGTPNGVLLGRALTAIAHAQTSFGNEAAVLDSDGMGGWTSGANQTLLFQTVAAGTVAVGVDIGGSDLGFWSGGTQSYAWTARLAQQVLQSDFDPNLVRLFDKAGQGAVGDSFVGSGVSLSVSLNGNAGSATQADLTSDYGFVDFDGGGGNVRVARAVAVAETAGGADDQMAVVRVRQNGQDNLGVTFYQVDDLAGTVAGLEPGDAGYAAAAQAAAYQLMSGGTFLSGPGYGNYTQNTLLDVDAGDYVAMAIFNSSSGQTYWAFSQANTDGQGHLWSYGLNTWGWEDTLGGGDRDFNDLIVQVDFTSAAGSGWLV